MRNLGSVLFFVGVLLQFVGVLLEASNLANGHLGATFNLEIASLGATSTFLNIALGTSSGFWLPLGSSFSLFLSCSLLCSLF